MSQPKVFLDKFAAFAGARVRARGARLALGIGVAIAIGVVGAAPAFARESAWWQVSSTSRPGVMTPGGTAVLRVNAIDLGSAPVSGQRAPVKVLDRLPGNLTASGEPQATAGLRRGEGGSLQPPTCAIEASGSVVSCEWDGGAQVLPSFEAIELQIPVKVGEPLAGAENAVSVSGGESYLCVTKSISEGGGNFDGPLCDEFDEGAGDYEGELSGSVVASKTASQPVRVGDEGTPFGVDDARVSLEGEAGEPETQAGAHPFQLTTTIGFNESESVTEPVAFPKETVINLPPGLIGDVQNIAQCTEKQFGESNAVREDTNACPNDSAVGSASVNALINVTVLGHELLKSVPVFNLVPSRGEPARFGFEVENVPIIIDTSVRTGSDYGITARVSNITEFSVLQSATVTLWGSPGAAAHRLSRGWSCISGGRYPFVLEPAPMPHCPGVGEEDPRPFLDSPTSCGALEASVQVASWQEPNKMLSYQPREFGFPMGSLDGCDRLPFSAGISVAPDVQEASKPTGLNVHIHVPQEASLNPNGLAGADVRNTTVTLPEGVALNPAGADGLEACSGNPGEQPGSPGNEIGFKGSEELNGLSEPGSKTAIFSPSLPEPLTPGTNLGGLGFCPNASKVGTVKIKTPLLAHELEGSVYLAAQNENPFGSLVAMYIVAEDPISGVLVKLPGEVSLNPSTGQITSTFLNTPQVPFEDLELHFFGGDRAPLSTPARCGTYTTQAGFTPWSGNPAVDSSSSFVIDSGPGGSACPGAALPFAPSLTAGSTSNQAGGFSPLTTTITREDGQQNIQQVTLHMPPGLSGVLSGVKLCDEAQANAGTCGAESLIGSTIVSVGLGGDPYSVTGGQVFLTEKVAGSPSDAPFGLSIVNPAIIGNPAHPTFNLGKVIVRATIAVDPQTAALTITTDGSGPYAIPHILDGIPLQIKHINVTIERKGFTFNPTDCNPLLVTGTVSSAEGASSPVSDPFQATNCASLKFAPKFGASIGAKTTKPGGASLHVKLTYPGGGGGSGGIESLGTQANIAKVKVDLPKQLPSRLTTLQKACVAKVFEADPANCPKESKVGYAKAITPILPVPLEGPAYFVSHGGEAFPSLIVVLQGYGVTVDLVGTTFISKAGITSSTFKTVPDVPVGSFELTLPTGKFSALAANLPAKAKDSFCGQKLAMPTAFVAQNGAVIHETTKIAIAGCPAARKAVKKSKNKNKKK